MRSQKVHSSVAFIASQDCLNLSQLTLFPILIATCFLPLLPREGAAAALDELRFGLEETDVLKEELDKVEASSLCQPCLMFGVDFFLDSAVQLSQLFRVAGLTGQEDQQVAVGATWQGIGCLFQQCYKVVFQPVRNENHSMYSERR